MHYQRSDRRLDIWLERDFNLLTTRQVAPLCRNVSEIWFDLSGVRLVDSEAIIFLDGLIRSGKTLRLVDAPPILFEVIRILELESLFKLDELCQQTDGSHSA